jgi:hypothetical protein
MHGAVTTIRFRPWAVLINIIALVPLMDARAEPNQEDPPSQPPRNVFSLDRMDAYLEAEASYYDNRVKTSRRSGFRRDNRQTNRASQVRESLGLELEGSILDPEILSYGASFSFGLSQDRFKEHNDYFDKTDSDSGILLEYDVRANLFQGRRLSGTVYGHQQNDRIPRQFQPTLREDRTGFGTSWVFAHDRFPMELTYDYEETDRTGNRERRDDEHFTESTLRYDVQWIVSQYNRFKLSYEHATSKQDFQGFREQFSTRRDLFRIEHELSFGRDHRNSLRTLIHWQEESGDFARDLLEIGPQLTVQHTDELQSMYKYQFNRQRYEGSDIQTQRGDFQLIHQKYTNLTTTFDAFGLFEDSEDDVNTRQFGTSVDWQYNRRNPLGHFYANLALAYDTENTSGGSGDRIALDEAATFRDPLPIILRNRDVARFPIIVTDTTGLRLFFEGVDYMVLQRRGATMLIRMPTGRIANGAAVLVDYRYRPLRQGQIDTLRVDVNVEQRFSNGVTPYYRVSYRNQENDTASFFARRADRTDHHRLGVRYEQPRYAAGGEIEVFDDSIDPYNAFHLDGLWHAVQTPSHSVDASARFSRFFFEGGFDRRNVNILDVEVDHRWHLNEKLSTVERLTYRWEDDSADGITNAWDAAAGIDYRLGDLTAEVTLEYDRLDLPDSIEDDVGIYVRVRRDIPNVFSAR